MEDSKEKFLAVQISSQSVRVAEVEIVDGRTKISRYVKETFDDTPPAKVPYVERVSNALSKAIEKSGSILKDCAVSITSQVVLETQVKLPPFSYDADRINQIIDFEINQHSPFPLEDCQTAYVFFPETLNCHLSFIKKDVYNRIMTCLDECGLSPFLVTTDSFSLLNAFRSRANKRKDAVLVNIGERCSDFVFLSYGDVYLTRTVPLGNATICDKIARDFQVSLEEAVRLENEHVFGSAWEDDEKYSDESDEYGPRVRRIASQLYSRLTSELVRSSAIFRKEYYGLDLDEFYATDEQIPQVCIPSLSPSQKMSVEKLQYPANTECEKNTNSLDCPSAVIIGLAEMIANENAFVLNYCKKRPSQSIMARALDKAEKILSFLS